jgi:hypothetical protein
MFGTKGFNQDFQVVLRARKRIKINNFGPNSKTNTVIRKERIFSVRKGLEIMKRKSKQSTGKKTRFPRYVAGKSATPSNPPLLNSGRFVTKLAVSEFLDPQNSSIAE